MVTEALLGGDVSSRSCTRTRTCSASGYQLLQSRRSAWARVGSTGLGLGHSREKWGLLPNPHTDFIFTIIGEELGLIGTLVVIALFVRSSSPPLRIAQQCTNEVYRLVAVGITTWIAVEALINIASVVGWWAVTGIPLPVLLLRRHGADHRAGRGGPALQHRPRHAAGRATWTIREHRVTNFRETLERSRTADPAANAPQRPHGPRRGR